MIRWRYCLMLAVMLLLPVKARSKTDEDDDDDRRNDESEEDGEDEDDDDDDEPSDKADSFDRRRAPAVMATSKAMTPATRTTKKHPLECYVCSFKSEAPLRSCLDPTKYRVHTVTCHSFEEKCFTSVISKGNLYESVVRGCRSNCLGSPETTCCELNRCNNQAFALPIISPHALTTNKSTKPIHPTVVFFITILLVLQTVVKVVMV